MCIVHYYKWKPQFLGEETKVLNHDKSRSELVLFWYILFGLYYNFHSKIDNQCLTEFRRILNFTIRIFLNCNK